MSATVRTPAKKPDTSEVPQTSKNDAEKAGPSPQKTTQAPKIRRSLGEPETDKNEPRPCTVKTHPHSPKQAALAAMPTAPQKPKQGAAPAPDTRRADQRPSVEATSVSPATKSEPAKTVDRVAQARVWLQRAKNCVSESRNLRSDLKHGIISAIDGLYNLVKEEAAASRSTGRSVTATKPETKEKSVNTIEMVTCKGDDTKDGGKNTGKIMETEEKEIMKILKLQTEAIEKLVEEVKEVKESASTDTSAALGASLADSMSQLTKKMEEHNCAMEECKEQSVTLTNQLKEASKELPQSYAQIASHPRKQQPFHRKPLHSVIISSSEVGDTSGGVIEKIRTAVDAKSNGLSVERLRKARDQKVVLGCRTEEELDRISERIRNLGQNLTVEKAENKDPLIILKDVLSFNTDEDIVLALKNQNKHLLDGITEKEQRLEIKYRRKTRNEHACHVVLRVSPQVWTKLTGAGKVHIDLQRVRVEDQSPLVQCSRCLGYGHSRKYCKEAEDLCSHCSGPHLRVNCPDYMAGAPPTCRNCQIAKQDRVDHNAFDQTCPIRRKWDRLARSTVAYC